MTQKYIFQNTGKLSIGNINPNYNITFHKDGEHVGVLDFNGPEMTFTGDVNESAKLFFDLIAASFKGRLEQERADEREACLDLAKNFAHNNTDLHDAIRARGLRQYGFVEAQPQQEPVAWLHIHGNFTEVCRYPLDNDEIDRGWAQKPLYLFPPPQRKPLTDEEHDKLMRVHLHRELWPSH